MASEIRSSGLGPAIFIGLTAYALVTSSLVQLDYANPAEFMDIDAIASPPRIGLALNPHPEFAPARRLPLAPVPHALPVLAAGASPDAAAVAGAPAQPILQWAWPAPEPPSRPPLPAPQPELPTVLAQSPTVSPPPAPTGTVEAPFSPPLHEPVVVTGNAVNLRAGPDIGATSLAQFDNGATALRVDRSGAWSRVLFSDTGQGGWMASRYLLPDAPVPSEP